MQERIAAILRPTCEESDSCCTRQRQKSSTQYCHWLQWGKQVEPLALRCVLHAHNGKKHVSLLYNILTASLKITAEVKDTILNFQEPGLVSDCGFLISVSAAEQWLSTALQTLCIIWRYLSYIINPLDRSRTCQKYDAVESSKLAIHLNYPQAYFETMIILIDASPVGQIWPSNRQYHNSCILYNKLPCTSRQSSSGEAGHCSWLHYNNSQYYQHPDGGRRSQQQEVRLTESAVVYLCSLGQIDFSTLYCSGLHNGQVVEARTQITRESWPPRYGLLRWPSFNVGRLAMVGNQLCPDSFEDLLVQTLLLRLFDW